MTTIDDFDEVVRHLSTATAIGDTDDELTEAANFVFRHGSLGEHFNQQQLRQVQSWSGPPGAAWAIIGHWSVQRQDPTFETGPAFEAHAHGCEVCLVLEDAMIERMELVGDDYDRPCDECGGLIEAHAIIVDGFRRGELVCVGQWHRTNPAVVDAGTSVFEGQVRGPAYSASWTAPLADSTWAVVCRTYYLTYQNGQTWLAREDEYIICGDLDRIDDTQIETRTNLEQLDSDYALGEDLVQLATDSFPPEPGEWQRFIFSREHFAVPAVVMA